jgi:hypothetical protein
VCFPNCLILIACSIFCGSIRDNFYKTNASNFFKNRKWSVFPGIVGIRVHDQSRLHLEFPELVAAAEPSVRLSFVATETQLYSMQRTGWASYSRRSRMWYVAPWANKSFVLDLPPPLVCAGAGNAILPLLAQNRNPELRIHAFDYSSHAVKLVQVLFNRCCFVFFFTPTCCSSKTLCTHHRPVERSRPPSGIYRPPRHLPASRRVLPTYLFSYLSSAPYILPNGPAPSPTSHRYEFFFLFSILATTYASSKIVTHHSDT